MDMYSGNVNPLGIARDLFTRKKNDLYLIFNSFSEASSFSAYSDSD
jgi:hypothetical protein